MAFTQQAAFDLLRRAFEQERLAHAYLITGGEHSGATGLARQLAGLVTGHGSAPGRDPFQHPDVHVAEPESKSRRIVIEQVRALERQLQLCASQGGKKVGIILDADRLQAQASNAFLKTLEEPPANSLLLLVSAMPEALLDTVLSRCILVPLQSSDKADLSGEEEQLDTLLRNWASERAGGGIAQVFQRVRDFAALLHAARERIKSDADAAQKKEESLYGKTTESDWLKDREDFYKGLIESRYIRARNSIIDMFTEWWADILRYQNGGPVADRGSAMPLIRDVATRFTAAQLLRKIELIQELRENLGRNVQEALALEVAFLGIFD